MINYRDSDILNIVFSTLVIKVSSIVKHFGSTEKFSKEYDFSGVTNGVLLVSSEMCSPPFRLEEFTQKNLIPKGLKPIEDFVFIEEMLTQGVKGEVCGLVNKQHPQCDNVEWLQSIIIPSGNFVWEIDPNLSELFKDAYFRLYRHLLYIEENKIKLNPRITKIDETYVYYTISDSKMSYKMHRDALWYNELKYGKSTFLKSGD